MHIKTRCRRVSLLAVALALAVTSGAHSSADNVPPRLVLQITVDQLRGDQPSRFLDRMGPGGFRYLIENGIVFANAHHAHANTETIVGHTTLATGAHPSAHGMVGNVWFDRVTGEMRYNIEDSRYRLLTAGASVDKKTEIDPTQRTARSDGRSPSAILVTTFSDELAVRTAGKAKIFGVSVKDRGAVSMAGHAGKAFWFSKSAGQFVTSNFYYDTYPEWVTKWNAGRPIQRYANTSWTLLHDRSSYVYGDRDDQPWETAMPGFGRVFPHPFGPAESKRFTTFLTLSPAGDEITLEFTKALIESEEIGKDAVTDYLSVSFSSTDYVGHLFGPSSLEAEDNLLRLDRTVSDLLAFVDEKVGLSRTFIVLSSDHGGPEVPGVLQSFGIEADYVRPESWETQESFVELKRRFGIGERLIRDYAHPYVYLDREVIRKQEIDLAEVQQAVAEEIVKLKGVALAVSGAALARGEFPDTPLLRSVLNNYHPKRSGDVFVVFEPHFFINEFDGLSVASTHGSPWRYDTFVPIVFAGAGLQPRTVYREIETVDVAPTMCAYLGMQAPSASRGQILFEVLASR